MARSKAATRKAKAAYSRRYRKTKKGKAVTKAYNKRTVKQRSSRNKARRKMAKKVGKKALKGKEVDHKNSNPKDNRASNLRVRKKGHGGGAKGNKNAKKK